MRAYAIEKGLFREHHGLHHDASVYDEDFDRQIDLGVREKLATQEKWIIESWLSGFFAQGVDKVLKVLVYCSDDAVRIDRIVNRDDVSVDEAKEHIHQRYATNLAKWSRLYAQEWKDWVVQAGKVKPGEKIDFWRQDLYDLCIDTYSMSREETLQKVLDALKGKE